MKNRNVITKLALLVTTVTVVLILLIGVTIAPGQGTHGAVPARTISKLGHRHGLAGMLPEESRLSLDGAPPVTRQTNNETSHVTAVTPQPSGQLRYRILDLGGSDSRGITESGDIVGASEGPFPYSCGGAPFRGRFWPHDHQGGIDLGTLPGLAASWAHTSNPAGQIVGFANNGRGVSERPVFWANPYSGPVELAGVPSGLQSQAYSITPSGRIVGQVFNDDFSLQRAVFWQNANSALVYLPQLSSAFPHSIATGINDGGNILGDGCDADFVECHAVYWASSTSTPVALASPGGQFIYTDIDFGKNINNAGNMVGLAYNADYTLLRGVYWDSKTSPAVVLSVNSSEFTNAIAESINEKREIVGGADNADFTEVHAFLWPSPTSPGIDLNTLIPADSGWTLSDAYDINNRGEIVGRGELNGIYHAYLLIPMP